MLARTQTSDGMTMSLFSAESPRQRLELELVRRVQSGDQTAFREIVERHQAKVFSVIYRLLRNRQDTEDTAQIVFTKAYFAIKSFDCRCSLLSWICRIAINECYTHLRKRRVRIAFEPGADGEEFERESRFGASPLPGADTTTVARDLLHKMLARVPEDDRWLLIMKEVEGHSVGELMEMTGASESSIKTKLFRARQKLVQVAEQLSHRPLEPLGSQPG